MAESKPVIVGAPLSPQLLRTIGALQEYPPAPVDFDPAGAWVNTYRIFACGGYVRDGNKNVGVLRLERAPGSTRGQFTLRIHQRIVNDTGHTHFLQAELTCQNDEFATLAKWRLRSWFVDTEGQKLPGLEMEQTGEAGPGGALIRCGNSELRRQTSRPLTSDWSLFEAIQRRALSSEPSQEFDLLEGLSTLRQRHRIRYRGQYQASALRPSHLHWFQQLGRGVLPYEYWLDDKHRLVTAVTLARAYILDDQADQLVDQHLKEILERNKRRRNA